MQSKTKTSSTNKIYHNGKWYKLTPKKYQFPWDERVFDVISMVEINNTCSKDVQHGDKKDTKA